MKRFFSNLVEWIAASLVVALAVIVFLQVFNRFVLKTPLAWSEDLAMLLFQWVSFLGAAIGVKRVRHFGIELVVRELSEKARRRIELIVPPLMAIVAITMITEGVKLINVNRARVYASMDVSYVWAFLAIPVSGCLIILYLILNGIRRWRGEEKGGRTG